MASKRKWRWPWITALIVLLAMAIVVSQLPAVGAHLLLHPPRKRIKATPPAHCVDVVWDVADGIKLKGWRGECIGPFRGTIIYLHGVADNREGSAGVMARFQKRGFDVIAYDSRGHGESEGDSCTYGYFEKKDLQRVIEGARPGPVVLIGSSLGAAVALQLAAEEPRIATVVAAETFSSLRTVATERAPFFFTRKIIERALKKAEEEGRFQVAAANPAAAARFIHVPVLLIHGAEDQDTSPGHSRRVWAALPGTKRLILVPGAGHNHSLNDDEVWIEIERWVDDVLGFQPAQ